MEKKICSNCVVSPLSILEYIEHDGVVITSMGKQGDEIEEILLVQYGMKWCNMFPLEKLDYYMDGCLYENFGNFSLFDGVQKMKA